MCQWSVVKVTGTFDSTLPPVSCTVAMMWETPPVLGTRVGSAFTRTVPTAAAPIGIEILAAAWLAPENALISAVPERSPALSRTVALPPFVRASAGSMLPREVVNVTTVPFCTGVPPLSSTLAVTSAEPPSGSNCVLVNNVIVVPVGARSGTLSHAPISAQRREQESDGDAPGRPSARRPEKSYEAMF